MVGTTARPDCRVPASAAARQRRNRATDALPSARSVTKGTIAATPTSASRRQRSVNPSAFGSATAAVSRSAASRPGTAAPRSTRQAPSASTARNRAA